MKQVMDRLKLYPTRDDAKFSIQTAISDLRDEINFKQNEELAKLRREI